MTTLILILAFAFQTIDNKPPFDEWTFIQQGTNADGVLNLHIAPKTIRRGDDQIKVWMQTTTVYGSPFRKAWHGAPPVVMPDLVRVEVTLECKKRRMTNGETILHNREFNMFYPYHEKENVKEQPGTLSWAVFEYFCEKEGKKLTGPPTLKSK